MKNKILLVIIIFLFLNNNLFAQQKPTQEEKPKPKPSMGLSVQPGGILIQHVKLGQTYDLYKKSGIALIIENKDSRPHSYIITTSKPSQAGNKKWLKGYLEILDPGWFWFEKNEITVGPQSRQAVKMYLKIPKEDRYYNQHWTVSLGVTGKHEKGDMFALAVYPRYQIETESKTGLKEKPDGLIGLEPSTLVFENVAPGKEEKTSIVIYNNDEKTHKYEIISKVIDAAPTREQIANTPGYSWIPDSNWIIAEDKTFLNWLFPGDETLEIKPGGNKELTVTVNIPKRKEYYQKKWEALIFVEPDGGPSGFVRVQIETNK